MSLACRDKRPEMAVWIQELAGGGGDERDDLASLAEHKRFMRWSSDRRLRVPISAGPQTSNGEGAFSSHHAMRTYVLVSFRTPYVEFADGGWLAGYCARIMCTCASLDGDCFCKSSSTSGFRVLFLRRADGAPVVAPLFLARLLGTRNPHCKSCSAV